MGVISDFFGGNKKFKRKMTTGSSGHRGISIEGSIKDIQKPRHGAVAGSIKDIQRGPEVDESGRRKPQDIIDYALDAQEKIGNFFKGFSTPPSPKRATEVATPRPKSNGNTDGFYTEEQYQKLMEKDYLPVDQQIQMLERDPALKRIRKRKG